MKLEEIIEVLCKARRGNYIVRRNVEEASSIAKSYKTCVIQLWEVSEKGKAVLFEARNTGQYVGESKMEMMKETEYIFMEKLFKWMDYGRV